MRGLDGVRDLLAQFREKFGDDTVPGEPFAVLCFEEFLSNDSVGIDEKISWARETLLHARGFRVQHAVRLNDSGVRICEQRIVNLVAVGEKFQDFFRVVADGRELQPLLFKSRDGALQLDQLPLAERSPIGGTEKE